MAEVVTQNFDHRGADKEVEQALREVETMTDEEIQRLWLKRVRRIRSV
jgi:hypothetical protein